MSLQKTVNEAMENAVDNGYSFGGWTFLQIAEDVVSYDKDLEVEPAASLVPMIKEWYRKSDVLFTIFD